MILEEKMKENHETKSVILVQSTKKTAAVESQAGNAPQSEQVIGEDVNPFSTL